MYCSVMAERRRWAPPVTNDALDRLFADVAPILTPEEVGELLRMNKVSIYRWLNEGYLPGHKIGNTWRILRDDLYVWMQQSRRPGGASPDS